MNYYYCIVYINIVLVSGWLWSTYVGRPGPAAV